MMVKYFQVDLKTMPAKITTETDDYFGLCSLMNLSDIFFICLQEHFV